MKARFEIDGSALEWVTDFLSDRSQTVCSGKANSGDAMLQFGVPQRWYLAREFLFSMPRTSPNFSASMDYITTCLLTTCEATAVAGL